MSKNTQLSIRSISALELLCPQGVSASAGSPRARLVGLPDLCARARQAEISCGNENPTWRIGAVNVLELLFILAAEVPSPDVRYAINMGVAQLSELCIRRFSTETACNLQAYSVRTLDLDELQQQITFEYLKVGPAVIPQRVCEKRWRDGRQVLLHEKTVTRSELNQPLSEIQLSFAAAGLPNGARIRLQNSAELVGLVHNNGIVSTERFEEIHRGGFPTPVTSQNRRRSLAFLSSGVCATLIILCFLLRRRHVGKERRNN